LKRDRIAEHNKQMWERLAKAAMNYTRPFGRPPTSTAGMRRFMDRLKQRPEFQVFDLPFGPGLTLVRRAELPPA